MSIEDAIESNTSAIERLDETLQEFMRKLDLLQRKSFSADVAQGLSKAVGSFNANQLETAKATVQQEPEVPTSATPEEAPSVAPTPSTAAAEAVAAPESKPEPSTTITQESVKAERTYTRDEFVRVVKEYAGSEADKSKIANLLAIAGTQTFRDVPEDKFAAVINAIPAAVVESVLKGA